MKKGSIYRWSYNSLTLPGPAPNKSKPFIYLGKTPGTINSIDIIIEDKVVSCFVFPEDTFEEIVNE